jgi:hypothetical protein
MERESEREREGKLVILEQTFGLPYVATIL